MANQVDKDYPNILLGYDFEKPRSNSTDDPQGEDIDNTMHRFNQAINTQSVEKKTLDGTEYAVAPITLLKPMNLNVPPNWGVNEAYLPKDQAKDSIPSWNGTPLTLNHPSAANGEGTTANSPEIHEKSVLGRVFNATWEDGSVNAEAWFNIPKIRGMGGTAENALERVLEGQSVEVSTGYRASKLPSGEYDGESRNAVQGNLKPDHVAVLPNDKGKCSVEAGCGVGQPVANSLIVTNAEMVDNQLSEARTPEFDGTETASWSDVSKTLEDWVDALGYEDVSSVEDLSEEQRTEVANHTLLGDTNADSWGSLRFFPVVNPNNQNLNQGALMAVLSGRGAQADISEDSLESARSVAQSLLEDEFDEEMSENTAWKRLFETLTGVFGSESAQNEAAESAADEVETNMTEKTQELVDNHGFKAENLPDEETDCFEAIYNRFVEEEEEETTENNENEDGDKVVFESEEAFENKVQSIVDNRESQSEKERLASEIVANSSEYEDAESVLEDFPTVPSLERMKKDVSGMSANYANARGAAADIGTNEEDASDLKMFGSDA